MPTREEHVTCWEREGLKCERVKTLVAINSSLPETKDVALVGCISHTWDNIVLEDCKYHRARGNWCHIRVGVGDSYFWKVTKLQLLVLKMEITEVSFSSKVTFPQHCVTYIVWRQVVGGLESSILKGYHLFPTYCWEKLKNFCKVHVKFWALFYCDTVKHVF